jgi:hypothetical protein
VILLSLALNIAVLVPVCLGLLLDTAWAARAFGPRTAGRSILLAVYGAILFVSVALLVWPDPRMAVSLLLMQMTYKSLTALTIGRLRHPVVVSNLVIAAVHAVTVWHSSSAS